MICTGFAFFIVELTCTMPVVALPPMARYCQVARPIRYSRTDTPETVRQIRAHNAAWVAACRKGR